MRELHRRLRVGRPLRGVVHRADREPRRGVVAAAA
jgi:hypothetical protein